MDLKATLDIIIKDLEETREIIDDLKNYPGVPALQIELAKSKCKSAAEMIALLKDLPLNKPVVDTVKENKTEVRNSGIYAAPSAESVAEPLKEKPSQQVEEVISRPAKEVINKQEKQVITIGETAIIADQFSNRPESYNETLGNIKREGDISEILKSKPVSSLSEAIGINDKFLFIREIFKGDNTLYNSMITRLDSARSFTDANEMISGIAEGNTENEAVKQLIEIVKRRFPSNE